MTNNVPFSLQFVPFFPFGQRQRNFPNCLHVVPLVHSLLHSLPVEKKWQMQTDCIILQIADVTATRVLYHRMNLFVTLM